MGTLCCPICKKVFTRAYNLQRHCKRATPCYEGEISGTTLNSNGASGSNQSFAEVQASLKRRKKGHYQRNAESLRIKAKIRARQRRGVRQGSDTSRNVKLDQKKQAELLWRRMIRAVHWRNLHEEQIRALASQMAQLWSPGSASVPPWVHIMYSAMKIIFADHPNIWDSWQNTWVYANFMWDDSNEEADSAVERIYCATRFDRAWRTGFPIKGLEDTSWSL